MTTQTPPAPPITPRKPSVYEQRDALLLRVQEIEQRVLPPRQAVVTAAQNDYFVARRDAVQIGKALPSRDAIEAAVAAVREAEEELAGLRDAIEALAPALRQAQDDQDRTRQAELLKDRAARIADAVRYRAEAATATAAAESAELALPGINAELEMLRIRVGAPV